jgi:hypothetical protein
MSQVRRRAIPPPPWCCLGFNNRIKDNIQADLLDGIGRLSNTQTLHVGAAMKQSTKVGFFSWLHRSFVLLASSHRVTIIPRRGASPNIQLWLIRSSRRRTIMSASALGERKFNNWQTIRRPCKGHN